MLENAFSHFTSAASRWLVVRRPSRQQPPWSWRGLCQDQFSAFQISGSLSSTRHEHHHLPHCVPDPEFAEPRYQDPVDHVGRIDPRTEGASDTLIDLESMTDAEIDHLHAHYSRLATHAKERGFDLDWEKDKAGRRSEDQVGQPALPCRVASPPELERGESTVDEDHVAIDEISILTRRDRAQDRQPRRLAGREESYRVSACS
jgi:hypothetical protein